MQQKVAHKGQTAKAESAGADSKLTKSQRLVRTRGSHTFTLAHTHTRVKNAGGKKKNSHKRKRQTWRRTKGKDLSRCTKAEETVRRR